jgi:hypothetical protein
MTTCGNMASSASWEDERVSEILGCARKYAGDRFILLLASDDAAAQQRANEAIRRMKPSPEGEIGFDGVDLLLAYFKYGDRLDESTRQHIRDVIAEVLQPGKRWYDVLEAHPYLPSGDWGLYSVLLHLLGGQILGRADLVARGRWGLDRALACARVLGTATIAEHTSPTYMGTCLPPMVLIGEYAADSADRIKARLMEERIWWDAVTRFHRPSSHLAGPFGRAYADGTIGGSSIGLYMLDRILPGGCFFDPEISIEYHHGDLWTLPWAALLPFHFPPYLEACAESKGFPYQVLSSSQKWEGLLRQPAGDFYRFERSDLTTYMTERYALGTASAPYWEGGQNDACILYWVRHQPVRTMADFGCLYTRYVVNDQRPGGYLLEQLGRLHTLQHEGTVLALYQPRYAVGDKLNRMAAQVLLPLYARPDEVWLGGRQISLDALPARGSASDTLFLRDAGVYIAVRPIAVTDLGGAGNVEVVAAAKHLIFSLLNLDSTDARAFARERLDRCRAGFVLVAAHSDAFPSFAAFRAHIDAVRVDQSWNERVWAVTYADGAQTLRLASDFVEHRIVARELNGTPLPSVQFESPNMVISSSGRLRLGDATLRSPMFTPLWFFRTPARRGGDDNRGIIGVVQPDPLPVPFGLDLGDLRIEAENFATGKLVYSGRQSPRIEVLAVEPGRIFVFPPPRGLRIEVNGVDVTQAARVVERGGRRWLRWE